MTFRPRLGGCSFVFQIPAEAGRLDRRVPEQAAQDAPASDELAAFERVLTRR
jgi:hypothetical protein